MRPEIFYPYSEGLQETIQRTQKGLVDYTATLQPFSGRFEEGYPFPDTSLFVTYHVPEDKRRGNEAVGPAPLSGWKSVYFTDVVRRTAGYYICSVYERIPNPYEIINRLDNLFMNPGKPYIFSFPQAYIEQFQQMFQQRYDVRLEPLTITSEQPFRSKTFNFDPNDIEGWKKSLLITSNQPALHPRDNLSNEGRFFNASDIQLTFWKPQFVTAPNE